MKIKPIVIIGPTASGKSTLAIEISKIIPSEIISADSMQIYKELDIATAKPTKKEQEITPHHLIDIVNFYDDFSVADYQKLAFDKIEDIISRKKTPIIVGGTGLYINSIIYNLSFSKIKCDRKLRKILNDISDKNGRESVHNILSFLDSKKAEKIHPNNLKRVIRAIENLGYEKKDKTFEVNKKQKYSYTIFYLNFDREKLYSRINNRVEAMIKDGLFEETKNLLDKNITEYKIPMQAIGYKEIIDFFNKTLNKEESIQLLKKNTRNYAKRQITWFKKIKEAESIDPTSFENYHEIAKYITKKL